MCNNIVAIYVTCGFFFQIYSLFSHIFVHLKKNIFLKNETTWSQIEFVIAIFDIQLMVRGSNNEKWVARNS